MGRLGIRCAGWNTLDSSYWNSVGDDSNGDERMSDTPRTDSVYFATYEEAGQAQAALYEHSCQLERELVAERAVHVSNVRYLTRKLECEFLKAMTFADQLRALLRERTKGEVGTWGFVAAFMQMIDEVEEARESASQPQVVGDK